MDPLFYGQSSLPKSDYVNLQSGKTVLDQLHSLVDQNQPMNDIYVADKDVMAHFEKLFPQVVETNSTGSISKQDFQLWEKGANEITIKFDKSVESSGVAQDVYVGGPAVAVGAATQAKSGESSDKVLYGHNGNKGVSNWKGSASYFHIRDCVPVYYWPDNHGAYTLYATVKHFLQRNLMSQTYKKQLTTDPNWNKLRLDWLSLIKEPSLLLLFAKNQYYAMLDVGFHMKGTNLRSESEQTAATTCTFASVTPKVLKHLENERPLILDGSDVIKAKAVYTFSGKDEEVKEIQGVIKNLESIAGGNLLEHKFLKDTEIKERGFGLKHVKKAAIFPNDGYFPPYLDKELEKIVADNGGQVNSNMQLKTILVKPNSDGKDVRVSKIRWQDTATGDFKETKVNSLYVSLGPSMKNMKVETPTDGHNALMLKSFANNLVGKMMWASAASIVFMVRVDKSKVKDENLTCLRDHIDGHNKHIVRLAEKDVTIGNKDYKYFVMQSTGGGHFPTKHAHAETALNVFEANIVPILDLKRDGIEYDILQVRSCARGVTAQNVFRLAAPASNMVMIYGLGGLGMTTMGGNSLLMKAMMDLRGQLASGAINEEQYKLALQTSSFNTIRHWNKPNPFHQNFAQFVDSNPKVLHQAFNTSKRTTTTLQPTLSAFGATNRLLSLTKRALRV